MQTSNIFERNLKAYNAGSRLIINQGGTRAGKTFSIMQLLFLIAKSSKKSKIISVVSYALPHLKLGAMRDFDLILADAGIIVDEIKNKTDNIYKIGNSIVEFWGTENVAKVHGVSRDILFANEVNFLKREIYDNLAVRTRQTIFMDYNPTQEFFIQTDIMPNNEYAFIHSTYKDNNFLNKEIIDEIESRKNNENWWKVYGLGEMGILEGSIFTSWEVGDFDNSIPYGFGLDFGFNPDPDTLMKVAIDDKRKIIYIKECFYEKNQTLEQLRDNISKYCRPSDLIMADSAEPRLINEIRSSHNIKAVNKYDGSVKEGIRMMQGYKLVVDSDSLNVHKELRNYVWNDKKAGIPIDAFNHGIDAIRYYVQTMTRKKPLLIKW